MKMAERTRGLKGQISALPLWVNLGMSLNLSKHLYSLVSCPPTNNWGCDFRQTSLEST